MTKNHTTEIKWVSGRKQVNQTNEMDSPSISSPNWTAEKSIVEEAAH